MKIYQCHASNVIKLLNRSLFALLLVFITQTAMAARCDWTVKGSLQVDYESIVDEMDALGGPVQPLENIEVRVVARAKVGSFWGPWNNWPSIRTDKNGDFSVTKEKNCKDRQFRGEVKFQDESLELRHKKSTSSLTKVKWYEVFNDKDQDITRTSGSTVNVGSLIFGLDKGGIFGQLEPRRHAQAWNIYQVMFNHLRDLGVNYEFSNKLVVKYPHDGVAGNNVEQSYANPITKIIYIHRSSDSKDKFDVNTLWHEAYHIWSYERAGSQNCLTADLILTQDTHDLAKTSCPAFFEGFAAAAAEALQHEVFGTPIAPPFSREGLKNGAADENLTTVDLVERLDNGWLSVFRTFLLDELYKWDFSGTGNNPIKISNTGGCKAENLKLKQLLKVFLKNEAKGFPGFINKDDMHMGPFFDRAVAVLNLLDRQQADAIISAQDPTATGKLCTLDSGTVKESNVSIKDSSKLKN